MKKLPSINYNKPITGQSKSLFEFWESGEFPLNISTPSVAIEAYRARLLRLFHKFSNCKKDFIISIGCGNGFIELELQNAGFAVVATDTNDKAVEIIQGKGLHGFRFDIVKDDTNKLVKADLIYADGLMGHIWHERFGYTQFFRKLYSMLKPGGRVIVSNDLCDENAEQGSLSVNADRRAQFYKSVPGYVATQIKETGLFVIVCEEIFVYERPGRGHRRREIVLCEIKNSKR